MPEATRVQTERLAAAQSGDEAAFGLLVAPYRGELHAHCYRMLGSVHDAEDALQETLLRSWRALPRFERRSSLRSWLYTIATNTSLNLIARRPARVLPTDFGPRANPEAGPGAPLSESVWVEPFADERLGAEVGRASPEARYDLRESIELAFVAALQHLPATQRAVLILREVLGYSAREVAHALDMTVPAVNSALQRARRAVDERAPEQTQQQTLRALGDAALEAIVDRYVAAWERDDVDAVVALLTEDATISMPPLRTWFGGSREEFARFLTLWPLSGQWRWKTVRTWANGQPAIGFYAFNPELAHHEPFALNVLSFRGELVCDVVAFVARATDLPARASYARWPDRPPDPDWMHIAFEQFGLPARL